MGDSIKKWEESQDHTGVENLTPHIKTYSKKDNDNMIKLTALHYKVLDESLEKYHHIKEFHEKRLLEWEKAKKASEIAEGDYIEKPFIEPFEFKDDEDYLITEKPFRIRLKDIFTYRENTYDKVEVTTIDSEVTYTVKESIEFIDELFGI